MIFLVSTINLVFVLYQQLKVIFDITSINNEKKIGANKEEIDKIKEKETI